MLGKASLMAVVSPVYHPREPTDSPLRKILSNHCEDFKADYEEDCEKQYVFFRTVGRGLSGRGILEIWRLA